ncbi:type II toxin-antitoxin system RelE/ParE family toxin [Ornithinibacillus halotolerans]|uniref:Type II toxin-antitoxin system RelE/ParE family toxin n=1 Tax=Ornithinibacillus halotolerans TaxID=1274357 RepID=A0A916WF46_9BACI|nr:type II toxin-antitoxin system RelE/ParE family toxin [Ornithinibacillus halotolerans]GGA91849.1 hypothetical protein GCM10008025_37900 [Ornithinibacillus halotolerans]
MENYKVEVLPEANNDIDEIFDYILLDNPEAAYNMMDKIFSNLEQLTSFPKLGNKLDHKLIKYYEFRMLNIDPYVAFYRIMNNTVYIYRILHGARDYIKILKDDK